MASRLTTPFVLPSSLQDLEYEPYNLEPYPNDFDDRNDSSRAESFDSMVSRLGEGNRCLRSGVWEEEEDDVDLWMDQTRLQSLYTLTRKSMSLSNGTRETFMETLCEAIRLLCRILQKSDETLTQNFRDAFSCHLYMLYSFMFLTESHAASASKKTQKPTDALLQQRRLCTESMLMAMSAMSEYKNNLWQRGVLEEPVWLLPCRSAYYLLERSSGVQARKAVCGDIAMSIIAKAVEHDDAPLTPVVAAMMDLMHSHEHMANVTAEICGKLCSSDHLAKEILREYGRLDGAGDTRATGVKNVAPFVVELAKLNPQCVLQQLPHLLPQFNAEAYHFRSALVTSLCSVLQYMHQVESEANDGPSANDENAQGLVDNPSTRDFSKSRGRLFDLLTERVFDTSSFTRSAVLKAWVSLASSKALPKERFVPATRMAMDRLNDKTVLVRKQAMMLLTVLLENNPFMGNLDPKPYRDRLNLLYREVMDNLPANIKEAQDQANTEHEGEEADKQEIEEVEQATLAAVMAEVESSGSGQDLSDQQQQYQNKVKALQFAQSTLEFIDVYEDATTNLEGMIQSANASDVTEALRFFVQARYFQLPCAVTGIKRSLALMWSSDQNIRAEVLKAFVDIFISEPGTESPSTLPDKQIAQNLLGLASQASESELASIEEAIVHLVKEERIPEKVFVLLWASAKRSPGETGAAAFQLIAMGAKSDRTIVDSKARLKCLLDSGFGDHAEEARDWKLVAAAAGALHHIERARRDVRDARNLVLQLLVEQLQTVCRGDWCDDSNTKELGDWFSACEQSIKAIFSIATEPEQCCAEIVYGMHASTLSGDLDACSPLRLARLFHVLGHIALSLLIHTEKLSSDVRRATAKKSLQKQEEKSARTNGSLGSSNSEEDNIEAELGVAQEQEAENERKMADIAEREILSRGLIKPFVPLLVTVVSNESGEFANEVLQQTSVLALCKFMCCSSQFCEQHLPLLFTVLNRSNVSAVMKANTVVALGDLAFRFPNEVEPYTHHIYGCLRDSSTKVRRHTMMVLTHLILNDMVKVKGNVCEIALCLRDQDQRISDMARLLFHELAKRSQNPIYNLLPDIVSLLSQIPNKNDDFRAIMTFLLGFIKKERQNEMLVEKFLNRFEQASSVTQKGDIAFCISLLKLNERSMKTLVDNVKVYKNDLFDEDIKRSFATIASKAKAKKGLSPEMGAMMDDWELKLFELAEGAKANEQAGARAKKNRRKARKKKLQAIDEDEDEFDFDKENSLPALSE